MKRLKEEIAEYLERTCGLTCSNGSENGSKKAADSILSFFSKYIKERKPEERKSQYYNKADHESVSGYNEALEDYESSLVEGLEERDDWINQAI